MVIPHQINALKKIILHIPHSSINIPNMEGYVVDKKILDDEILKLTDWYTDDIFHSDNEEMVIADFSRIFCDPERFSDDTKEIMSQYGMGVLYEKSDTGDLIRKVSPELRKKILRDYYWSHHNMLSANVNEQLKQVGKAFILDCHSYPSTPFKRDLDQRVNRPDFNIGTDPFHTPDHLIEFSKSFFKEAGYTLGIDWPYSGSIVPLEHYEKNKDVQTLMLEINRALYLKEPTSEKSDNYVEIKALTQEFIKRIKNVC